MGNCFYKYRTYKQQNDLNKLYDNQLLELRNLYIDINRKNRHLTAKYLKLTRLYKNLQQSQNTQHQNMNLIIQDVGLLKIKSLEMEENCLKKHKNSFLNLFTN